MGGAAVSPSSSWGGHRGITRALAPRTTREPAREESPGGWRWTVRPAGPQGSGGRGAGRWARAFLRDHVSCHFVAVDGVS